MTKELTRVFIDNTRLEQLVKSLIDMIQTDNDISDDTEFFICATNTPIKKSNLSDIDTFYIEPFILGVWHFIIMNRSWNNEDGQATYDSWYQKTGEYTGTIGASFNKSIKVHKINIKAQDEQNSSSDSNKNDNTDYSRKDSTTGSQYINNGIIVNQNGEKNIQVGCIGILNL